MNFFLQKGELDKTLSGRDGMSLVLRISSQLGPSNFLLSLLSGLDLVSFGLLPCFELFYDWPSKLPPISHFQQFSYRESSWP